MTGTAQTVPASSATPSAPRSAIAPAQASSPSAAATAPPSSVGTGPQGEAPTLLDGTPVKLRLSATISSANATAGEQVAFEVTEPVQVDGVTVIAKGATALATVTEAEHKKTMGRGGKLNINIDSVRLVDQEKAQLRATAGGKAGGHTAAMTTAMVASGILFFPAAPLFLFIHGKDITLPKGLEATAFVEGDMPLNLQAMASADAARPGGAAGAAVSQVNVDANVANCDIEVDGAFAGSTPSELSLATGKHVIAIRKSGYGTWQRTVMVSGTAIRMHADLTPDAAQAPETAKH